MASRPLHTLPWDLASIRPVCILAGFHSIPQAMSISSHVYMAWHPRQMKLEKNSQPKLDLASVKEITIAALAAVDVKVALQA